MATPKKLEKFGVQMEKPRKIYCFANGDINHKGVTILLNPKKFLNYDQLKAEMTRTVGLVTGAVFKVMTPDGKTLKSMDEFEDGKIYVCCGAEPLKKDQSKHLKTLLASQAAEATSSSSSSSPALATGSSETEEQEEEKQSASAPTPSPVSSSAPPPSSSSSVSTTSTSPAPKKREKFGVQTEKAKVLLCFRNGDKHHQGERITVSAKKYKNYDQLMQDMTKIVKIVTGAVRKVCTTDGKVVKSMEDLEDGKSYVCCGAEPFDHEGKALALRQAA